jgi:hypothetical protein
MIDRIDIMEGGYVRNEIRGTYDVAGLSQFLHGESPEDCQMIARKAVAPLNTGGLILVDEFLLDDTMDGPLFPTLFSLNMLLATNCGQRPIAGRKLRRC